MHNHLERSQRLQMYERLCTHIWSLKDLGIYQAGESKKDTIESLLPEMENS